MKARPHTTTVRLSAGDARALLDGLAPLRARAQVPEQLDNLAERLTAPLPADERASAYNRYRYPKGNTP